jgi:hypothetical protein
MLPSLAQRRQSCGAIREPIAPPTTVTSRPRGHLSAIDER